MHIGKNTCLLVSLFIVLVIGVSGATAQLIQPSGKTIGSDKQSNAIYQVHANGIEIGYKLIGSGEPLVMIMGLGGTMDRWPEGVIETLSKKYQLIGPSVKIIESRQFTRDELKNSWYENGAPIGVPRPKISPTMKDSVFLMIRAEVSGVEGSFDFQKIELKDAKGTSCRLEAYALDLAPRLMAPGTIYQKEDGKWDSAPRWYGVMEMAKIHFSKSGKITLTFDCIAEIPASADSLTFAY